MEDAVTVLSRQHDETRRLMREVKGLPRISLGATGPDLRRLQELMDELRRCFVVHERLKERHLWPVLRRDWPDGDAISRGAGSGTSRSVSSSSAGSVSVMPSSTR
jgi:hypothetical protein